MILHDMWPDIENAMVMGDYYPNDEPEIDQDAAWDEGFDQREEDRKLTDSWFNDTRDDEKLEEDTKDILDDTRKAMLDEMEQEDHLYSPLSGFGKQGNQDMKIKTITSQHRRDFRAIYECEHCNATKEGTGYDDGYFHNNVIPKMKCTACHKIAGDDYTPNSTKYPDGMQVQHIRVY